MAASGKAPARGLKEIERLEQYLSTLEMSTAKRQQRVAAINLLREKVSRGSRLPRTHKELVALLGQRPGILVWGLMESKAANRRRSASKPPSKVERKKRPTTSSVVTEHPLTIADLKAHMELAKSRAAYGAPTRRNLEVALDGLGRAVGGNVSRSLPQRQDRLQSLLQRKGAKLGWSAATVAEYIRRIRLLMQDAYASRRDPKGWGSGMPVRGGLSEANEKILLLHVALRADLDIEIPYPRDLTPAEAERLSVFIKALPLAESVAPGPDNHEPEQHSGQSKGEETEPTWE